MQEFARGLQLDGDNVELQEEAKAARQLLSLEDLNDVRHRFDAFLRAASHTQRSLAYL